MKNQILWLDKLATYNGNRKTETHKKLADLLIVPDVKDHNTIDFGNLSELVVAGEDAAKKYGYILANLSSPQDFKEIKSKALKEEPLQINKIKLEGNSILTLKKVNELKPSVKNRKFTKADLNDWTKKIYSVSYIERVFYEVNDDTVIFKVKEKDGINIRASLNYASNYGGSMNIAATVPNFGIWTRNYTIKAEASNFPKVNFNNVTFYEVGKFKLLGGASIGYETDPLFIYKNGDKVSTYTTNKFIASLSLGTAISNSVVSGISLGYANNDNKYLSGDRDIYNFNENYQSLFSSIYTYVDTLNEKNFPSKGTVLRLEGFNSQDISGKETNLGGGMFSANFYTPLSEKFSVGFGVAGGKMRGEELPKSSLFRIGGLRSSETAFSFVGLPMMGRYADEFYILRSGIQYKLTDTFHLLAKYNMLTYSSDSLPFQDNYSIGDRKYHGYGGGIGWNTFLGPISLFLSNNLDDSSPLFEVYMGYTF